MGNLPVYVASSVDMENRHSVIVVDDGVDDAVVAAARRAKSDKFVVQSLADALGISTKRAEYELNTGCGDLFRQAL